MAEHRLGLNTVGYKAVQLRQISLGQAGLLGWTSWLKSITFTRDADDVVLNPIAA